MKASERVLPLHREDGEPSDHELYDEYVRGFDDVPVLVEAVSVPPRRPSPPSFVRGERRSQRKVERPDSYTARESQRAALEELYREYLEPEPAATKRRPARPKKSKRRKR